MTITNHALAGALVATLAHNPWVALPVAFASHFVLDAIPHYGYDHAGYAEMFRHKLTWLTVTLDMIGVVVLLYLSRQASWVVFVSMLAALAPDAAWPVRYFWFERVGKQPPNLPLTTFHQSVQWCEKPWGFLVELGFYSLMLSRYLDRV